MKSIKKLTLLTALFALVLSFSFSASYAQDSTQVPQTEAFELEGDVVDAESGDVLVGAQVAIVGQDINTVSGDEGEFSLENLPSGEHTVKVTLDGYQTWEKKLVLEEDTELTIELIPTQ